MADSKTDYEVSNGFWDKGIWRAKGALVSMTDAEASAHRRAGDIKPKAAQTASETPAEAKPAPAAADKKSGK